jgi:hypothetical protein
MPAASTPRRQQMMRRKIAPVQGRSAMPPTRRAASRTEATRVDFLDGGAVGVAAVCVVDVVVVVVMVVSRGAGRRPRRPRQTSQRPRAPMAA